MEWKDQGASDDFFSDDIGAIGFYLPGGKRI
jgi:hypothetical protein